MTQSAADRAVYRKAYYAENREREIARSAAYNRTHVNEIATYRAANKGRIAAYHKAHRAENPEKSRSYGAARSVRLKAAAMDAYGGARCVCCGETLLEGLSIDHISGDGATQRRNIGGKLGVGFYSWLKQHDYPPGYQVLCGTCNMAKGTGDHCPHEDAHIAWG
jgi:hypothetical protein